MDSPILAAKNLSKRFRTLAALRNISLDVLPGEVLGITGQTGSGKSTLAKILAGIVVPDEGKIIYKETQLSWPFKIRNLGMEIIHQIPNLAENLDITSNIFLGNEIGWSFGSRWLSIPNQLQMDQKAAQALRELGMPYRSLREQVSNLPAEKKQVIAIAKVMTSSPDMIIIDDPGRLLSYPYQQKLLAMIQKWREANIGILFISNNLDHLLDVSDRIMVLREGYRAAEFVTEEANREEIIAALVGTTDYQQLTPIIWALDSYYNIHVHAERLLQGKLLFDSDLIDQDVIRQRLIDQLTEQITILDGTNLALQNAQRRLLTELEKERKYLAREIHDEVIQDLLSINFQLEEKEATIEPDHTGRNELVKIRSNIRDLIDELRNICGNLRPPTIDSLGLRAAIQSFSQEWSNRCDIKVEVDLDESIDRLPEPIELSIYRIVQEALNNVNKHSSASAVVVTLKQTTPRALMVSISDNGLGVEKDINIKQLADTGHYGLLGVNERVALLGGRLRIQNKPEGGLLVQAMIPHPRKLSSELDETPSY